MQELLTNFRETQKNKEHLGKVMMKPTPNLEQIRK
jgi:hypothetical protein